MEDGPIFFHFSMERPSTRLLGSGYRPVRRAKIMSDISKGLVVGGAPEASPTCETSVRPPRPTPWCSTVERRQLSLYQWPLA